MSTVFNDKAAHHMILASSALTMGSYIHHNQLAALYRRLAAIHN